MAGNSAFTIEDAPAASPQSAGFTIEDAPPQPVPSGSIHGPEKPSPQNQFQGTMGGNPFERYMTEAENMTQEGAKEHPIENFLGQTVTKARDFGGKLATMAMLLSGPEGLPSLENVPAYRQPIPQGPSSLTPDTQAIVPYVHQGEVVEPPARVPANAPSNVAPKPEVAPAAGPQKPPAPLTNRQLAKNIEAGVREAAGTKPGMPIYNRSVGARAVLDIPEPVALPNEDVAGPAIKTPSSNKTEVNTMGEQVEQVAGGKPKPAVTKGYDEQGKPLRVLTSERNAKTFYENNPDFGPKERQEIHTNLEVDRVPIPNAEKHWELLKDKPGVRDDLFAMQNDQVREALRKSDLIDMKNKTVASSDMVSPRAGAAKFKDPNIIPRAKAIGQMLDAGIPPEEIVKMGGGAATRTRPAMPRFKFGEQR